MNRLAKLFFVAVVLACVGSVAAQDVPLATPQTFPTLPPAEQPTAIPPTPEGLATLAPAPDQTAQTTESAESPAATEAPTAVLGVEQTEAIPILISDRADLDLLADAALGKGQRPLGWSGSIDVTNPQLPVLIRLDLELLAGAVMGADKRPDGWFGVVPSVPLAVARDIRHDLELLADVVVGASGIRPGGWKGDDPIMRCDRAVQSLITTLRAQGVTIKIDFELPNYCDVAEMSASRYVERQILQPPPATTTASIASNQGRYPVQVDKAFVIAFSDRAARHKVGILPVGTGFTPEGRSYTNFSNMMLVKGDNFEVFVDYTTTPVTRDQFLGLADIGSDSVSTTCTADWCDNSGG